MSDLVDRLEEACLNANGEQMPDHAEPWGADVGLLREAAAELRRVREAPVGECVEVGDDETGQPRVLVHTTRDELRRGPPLAFRNVRLVPERGKVE